MALLTYSSKAQVGWDPPTSAPVDLQLEAGALACLPPVLAAGCLATVQPHFIALKRPLTNLLRRQTQGTDLRRQRGGCTHFATRCAHIHLHNRAGVELGSLAQAVTGVSGGRALQLHIDAHDACGCISACQRVAEQSHAG